MANQITDNRTLLFDGGDGTGGTPVAIGGVTVIADTSTYLEGSSSFTCSVSNSEDGMLFDAGSDQNYSGNIFYLTVNCGVVGLLVAKASGGLRIRFGGSSGAGTTDYFEVYVAGNDFWPNSIQGGWTNFVVDIDDARAAAVTNGWTAGTVPATSAIRYVGVITLLGSMPKMADNLWLDTIHRLPSTSPGIIIEGRNGGTTDWNSANILTQLGSGQMAFYSGAGGAYVLSTPIQFGINDTTTHGFTDTNFVWLWDNQEYAPAGFYGLSALGNSGGTTNVTFGVKSGSGDSATGSQGGIIQAASSGVRWIMDFDDANLDTAGFYGCSFIHGGDLQLDGAAVEAISTSYLDCSSATITGSVQLRNFIINANTADGVAFMTTDDLGDIKYTSFEFSDGHAIELTTPRVASQTSLGNTFSGYGATGSNDAAVYNNTAGAVTINVTSGDAPTYRNGTSATTSVVSSASYVVSNVIVGSEVRFIDVSSPITELAGVENAGGSPEGISNVTVANDPDNTGRKTVTYTYDQADAPISARIVVQHVDYIYISNNVTLPTTGGSLFVSQVADRNYLEGSVP